MVAKAALLADYNAKCDFERTREPRGRIGGTVETQDRVFMVQEHDATRLHFDFYLELKGVPKSWAVTRGPGLDPADECLAVRTEDHPLSYATFEGVIPAGEYGGGIVMLWDRGLWTRVPGKDPARTIAEGHFHLTLTGKRMTREWLLVRMKPPGRETRENWLLCKVEDAAVDLGRDLVATELTSVDTGRTMAEIAAARDAVPAARASKAASPANNAPHGRGRRRNPHPAPRPPSVRSSLPPWSIPSRSIRVGCMR